MTRVQFINFPLTEAKFIFATVVISELKVLTSSKPGVVFEIAVFPIVIKDIGRLFVVNRVPFMDCRLMFCWPGKLVTTTF